MTSLAGNTQRGDPTETGSRFLYPKGRGSREEGLFNGPGFLLGFVLIKLPVVVRPDDLQLEGVFHSGDVMAAGA